MVIFEEMLQNIGYKVERLDPGKLWKTGNIKKYTISRYLKDIKEIIDKHKQKAKEIVLIGHSLGGFMAIIAGNKFPEVTKIVSLCPPSSMDGLINKELESTGYRTSTRNLPGQPKKERTFQVPYSAFKEAQKHSALKAIKKINKPVMIFIAEKDESVPPEETEKLISASKVKPHVVRQPNMGHNFRHSPKEARIVTKHIKNFLIKTSAQ